MGQKVNPIGYRLGVNKDWDSKWYAKKSEFGDTLNKDIKIREYLDKNLKDAGIASVTIGRKKERTEVNKMNLSYVKNCWVKRVNDIKW